MLLRKLTLTKLVTYLNCWLRNIAMDKKLLIEKIKGLSKIYYEKPADKYDEYILETVKRRTAFKPWLRQMNFGLTSPSLKTRGFAAGKIKNLIDEHLAKNPLDTDMRLRLVMLEYAPPWENTELLSKYLDEIFKYDPDNIYATLILACTQDIFWGKITDTVFKKLNNLSSKNAAIFSMIELAKAWYYQCKNNDELYEKHLLSSISHCNKHVKNYKSLAYFYAQKGRKDEATKFSQQALHNVQVIYTQDSSIVDITDIEKFINEYFKGAHITEPNLESIYELLK